MFILNYSRFVLLTFGIKKIFMNKKMSNIILIIS